MSRVEDDDDQLIGRPVQAPLSSSHPAITRGDSQVHVAGSQSFADAPAAAYDDARLDEGPGRPKQVAVEMGPLTETDHERIRQEQMREENLEKRRLEESLASDTTLGRLPAFLAHPLAISFAVGMAGLVGLFVFSQVTSTLASLASLNDVLRYVGYAGLTLLTSCTVFAVGRLAVFYYRFHENHPLPLKGLDELSKRTRLRWLVHEKKHEAREQLAAYLRRYPLDSARERNTLQRLGLTTESLQQLERAREELLDMNRFASNDDWVSEFRSRFQAILDEAAAGRVTYFGRRVAVSTAVSPNTLVDALLTAYCGFTMLADLCQVYNLRLGRFGTLVLLGRVFFNACAAGQLHEFKSVTESVTEAGIGDLMSQTGMHLSSHVVDAAMTKIASKAGARVATGVLNLFLLKRLGSYASRLLRPVQTD